MDGTSTPKIQWQTSNVGKAAWCAPPVRCPPLPYYGILITYQENTDAVAIWSTGIVSKEPLEITSVLDTKFHSGCM